MHQKLIPDLFLILVNNLKQPLHARNSFTNQIFWKRMIKKLLKSWLYLPLEPHVIHTYSCVILMSLVCTRTSSVCHSYVLVCHPYVTRIYSYVICMSLVCVRMSSVCHSYVLVCHPYVPRMSSVYHSYVLVRHPYVTCMCSYVIRMPLVCTRMSSVCHSYVVLPWTILEIYTKKNSLRNLARLHGGLFELDILEIFATAFLLKTIIWTWLFFKHCRVLSLKTK